MKARIATTLFGLGLCLTAPAQSWVSSYAGGLQAARAGHWHEAREDFRQAAANRTEDMARPTFLGEGRKWRNGSPYSPNFLAAYSGYREAVDVKDTDRQTSLMRRAASEFETLLAKHEQSRDVYFFLQVIYTRLSDQAKLNDLIARQTRNASQLTWKVDEEVVAPEELSAMSVGPGTPGNVSPPVASNQSVNPSQAPQTTASDLTTGTTGQQLNPIVPGLGIANVPTVPGKFALLIGESTSGTPYASRDVEIVRDGLVNYGGYAAGNVTSLTNPTAAQVIDAAKQLAARVQQDGVALIYFVGSGLNRDGKDYLVTSDSNGQVAKMDICNQFLIKGARVFSFFEVNRPIVNEEFFGAETPYMGAISQMEATVPDSSVTAVYYNGQPVGLYALSFANVLAELRSNRIPIYEFGWQVFNKMRRGNTGTSSGASRQIPTLPVLNNLAADARF